MRRLLAAGTVSLAALLALSCSSSRLRRVEYRLQDVAFGPVARGIVQNGRAPFADVFCATLEHVKAGGETWQACGEYLDLDGAPSPVTLGPLPPVRVLVVAGVFSECLEGTGVVAFGDAEAHLEDPRVHPDVSIEPVKVSALGSSAANARQIRDYVVAHPGPFIAVGYSKGAGDWMEAIAAYPEVRSSVTDLVTIAGSVAGSRLPDQFRGNFLKWVQGLAAAFGLPGCTVSDGGGLASLGRPDRVAFLKRYPVGAVPAFSLAAVATDDRANKGRARTISRVLQAPWTALTAVSLDQDSQVIAEDALVPGGTLLGYAKADHWAVALPFERTTDPDRRRRALRAVDRYSYPRTALLEAAIRFALAN